MNILIGLAVILVLMLSEGTDSIQSTDLLSSLLAVAMLMSLAPLTAVLLNRIPLPESDQSADQGDRCDHVSQFLRRGIWLQAAIWFAASIATVVAVEWPVIVRDLWGLAAWPLLDEIVILTPMLGSLILTWCLQFDLVFEQPSGWLSRKRWGFVALHCRVYLLVLLVPVLAVAGFRDLGLFSQSVPPLLLALAVLALLLVLVSLMPLIIGLLWNNRAITEAEGRGELLQLCRSSGLMIGDIRVWETGNQIVNALIAGVFPRMRILMVTDLLIRTFPPNELRAVLRHEVGHARLLHLPLRIMFIMLPAAGMLCLEWDPNQTLTTTIASITGSAESVTAKVVPGLLFLCYVVSVTGWLSRKMEFEADLFAIGAFENSAFPSTDDQEIEPQAEQSTQAMIDALMRLGERDPDQMRRRSLTHPSLDERIGFIRKAASGSGIADRFRRKFLRCQLALFCSILLVTAVLFII